MSIDRQISSSYQTLDEVQEILQEAKGLAARYFTLTGKSLGVTGEVAELEAAQKLNLVLTMARNPGFDAFRETAGVVERFQIKGRAVDPTDRYRGRMPSVKCGYDFEWVLLVLLDRSSFDTLEIWRASRFDVGMRLQESGSRARNERNSMGITQFISIARKIWPAAAIGPGNQGSCDNPKPTLGMKPADAMRHVNQRCKRAVLNRANTHFANINQARRDIWWFDVPLTKVEGPDAEEIINLLLYNRFSSQIHHLRVPTSYLRENIRTPEPSNLRVRRDTKAIDLWLSADNSSLFQDLHSKCCFRHLICECSR